MISINGRSFVVNSDVYSLYVFYCTACTIYIINSYSTSKRNYAKSATWRMDIYIIVSSARPALVNSVFNTDCVSLLQKL